jgi:hypothetical protein
LFEENEAPVITTPVSTPRGKPAKAEQRRAIGYGDQVPIHRAHPRADQDKPQ